MLISRTSKISLICIILSLSIGCDQTTKRIAEKTLKAEDGKSFLFDTIRLKHIENPGAFLSFGADFSEPLKNVLFLALPLMVLLSILIFLLVSDRVRRFDVVMLALIAGGGFGNLIDRALFNGRVTDFLNLGIGTVRTGIFNVADVAIMVGVFGLLFAHFRKTTARALH